MVDNHNSSIPHPIYRPATTGLRPSLFGRVAGRAVRIVFVGVIVLLGWTMIESYRGIFADPPAAPSLPADPRSLGPTSPELTDIAGAWVIDDAGWSVEWSVVTPPELAERFRRPGPPVKSGPPSKLDDDLIGWVTAVGRRSELHGAADYTTSVGPARVRVVASDDGLRVRLAQVAWPTNDTNDWAVVEAVPRFTVGRPSPGLIPLPAGAAVLAHRESSDGRPVASLVRLPTRADGSPAANGWTVSPTDPDRFRITTADSRAIIYGWRLPNTEPGGDVFLLTAGTLIESEGR